MWYQEPPYRVRENKEVKGCLQGVFQFRMGNDGVAINPSLFVAWVCVGHPVFTNFKFWWPLLLKAFFAASRYLKGPSRPLCFKFRRAGWTVEQSGWLAIGVVPHALRGRVWIGR